MKYLLVEKNIMMMLLVLFVCLYVHTYKKTGLLCMYCLDV